MLLLLFGCLAAVSLILYYYSVKRFGYWKERNVPHVKPVPFLGTYGDFILMKKNFAITAHEQCKEFPNEPLVGAYFGTEPALIVQDPALIKLVTTKDFYYFSGRENSDYINKEVITQNLFSSYGDNWKVLRQNLTPMFTSAKMKNMFYLIANCTKTFETLIDDEVNRSDIIKVRPLIGRFTMDCIGSCAFGLDTKAMEDEHSPFQKIGHVIFDFSVIRTALALGKLIWPGVFYGVGLKAFPKSIHNFFNTILTGVFKERNNKPSLRNDFVDLVLTFNEKKEITGDSMTNMKTGEKNKVSVPVSDDLLVAQCFIFFAAGFETSATTVSFLLYELAKHPEIQNHVIKEVDEYLQKHKGMVNYECVTELPYTEQCIDETLRLYPVLGTITREVVEKYTFPGTKVTVEKGIRVHLPTYHIQRNPKYFPEPEKFDPERFSPEGKKNIEPYSYFPFGEGPRVCIGLRFAKMQMMAGLVTIFRKYRVELAPDTPHVMDYEPRSIVTQLKQPLNLRFVRRMDIKS